MAESVSHFFQPKTKRFGEVDGFAKSEPGRPTLLDPMVAPPLGTGPTCISTLVQKHKILHFTNRYTSSILYGWADPKAD
jgi:hypothetical protein